MYKHYARLSDETDNEGRRLVVMVFNDLFMPVEPGDVLLTLAARNDGMTAFPRHAYLKDYTDAIRPVYDPDAKRIVEFID